MMIKIYIYSKASPRREIEFSKKEISIGRASANDIVLSNVIVSKRHAKFTEQDGKYCIQDLNSSNGTFVNGERIDSPRVISVDDKISIGEFLLQLADEEELKKAAAAAKAGKRKEKESPSSVAANEDAAPVASRSGPQPLSVWRFFSEDEDLSRVKKKLYGLLLSICPSGPIENEEEVCRLIGKKGRQMLDELGEDVPSDIDKELLLREVLDELLRLGPLTEPLRDPGVTGVMINGRERIYVERAGQLAPLEKSFSSNEALLRVLGRLVAPVSGGIGDDVWLIDTRLPDGLRINAVMPPYAAAGPVVSIRKGGAVFLSLDDLVEIKSLSRQMAEFLKTCVLARQNILVVGPSDSGRTTLLNVLAGFVPEYERIVTIEKNSELCLSQENVIALRMPFMSGKGVTLWDLFRTAQKMGPERILLGECRAEQVLELLQAFHGMDGFMAVTDAATPESLLALWGNDFPATGEGVFLYGAAPAVNILVGLERLEGGEIKVIRICEVIGRERGCPSLADIFYFAGGGAAGAGSFNASGVVPDFYGKLKEQGYPIDLQIFKND